MGQIYLENIRTYSHHGCMEEETVIGSEYRVDLWVDADLTVASSSDDLKDTPDYVVLHQIVVKEMKIPSRLLEHVAQRIIERIRSTVKDLDHIRVRVSKINPPIGGDVQSVSVLLEV
ncbi:MAG: dihydroneopterin aldolase [Bacteroidota bacterium]|nr:dihydroneopterin aldolase [Bacteroidota bacterium]